MPELRNGHAPRGANNELPARSMIAWHAKGSRRAWPTKFDRSTGKVAASPRREARASRAAPRGSPAAVGAVLCGRRAINLQRGNQAAAHIGIAASIAYAATFAVFSALRVFLS